MINKRGFVCHYIFLFFFFSCQEHCSFSFVENKILQSIVSISKNRPIATLFTVALHRGRKFFLSLQAHEKTFCSVTTTR